MGFVAETVIRGGRGGGEVSSDTEGEAGVVIERGEGLGFRR